jgi:hypothetical protein
MSRLYGRSKEEQMNVKKAPYAGWHKAVLIGCLIVALLGTIGAIGALVKISGTISDYGGKVGAPVVLVFLMMLLSVWLFAGAGALLVYIAKSNRDLGMMVEAMATAGKE